MKNLLRKLHIGGNHDDEVDAGRIIEGRSSHDAAGGGGGASGRDSSAGAVQSTNSGSPTSFTAVTESKPSGIVTIFNAVKDSVGRVGNSNEKSGNLFTNAIGHLMQRRDSASNNGRGGESGNGDGDSPPSRRVSSPPDSAKRYGPSPPGSAKRGSLFSTEILDEVKAQKALGIDEDLQVQMAMALSVSGNYQTATVAGVVEKAQIEAAKRISLGLSPNIRNTESDTISYRYWALNVVDYTEHVPDGFYDVSGLNSESQVFERIPLLADLQSMPVSDTSKIEVVLVQRDLDPELLELQEKAAVLAGTVQYDNVSLLRISLAKQIALMVADHMGGPVGSETDMLLRWQKSSWEVKSSVQNIVLTLGSLTVGLTRHRALLFKVLADHVGIPCQLVKGRHYPGVEEEGAVNIIKVDDNREYIIDLMGAPGALLPSDRTVTNSVELDDASPKSSKTGQSSSLVSSTQSSPSSSTRSTRSDTGDHNKEKRTMSSLRDTDEGTEQKFSNVKLEGRHNSEPTELQGLDLKPARFGGPNRPSHWRSPSWTEGIGLPAGQQGVAQIVMNAAKDPQLAQKLHDVLLESGVLPDISPKQLQVQTFEDLKLSDEFRFGPEKLAALQGHPPRKRSNAPGPGRPPPPGSLKPRQAVTGGSLGPRDRLERLNSVEGLGERRPLGNPVDTPSEPAAPTPSAAEDLSSPAATQSPTTVCPPAVAPSPPAATPSPRVALPSPPMLLPMMGGVFANVENSGGFVPVAAAAAAAATAAVVASTMVAAATKGEGMGDPKMEVPIAAAATATAAVVAATSAVAGRMADSNSSSPHASNSQQGDDVRPEQQSPGSKKGGSIHSQRHSDERKSETGSTPGSSHTAESTGDGLDGEVSVDEERNSDILTSNVQRKYDAVRADVAEWEIPWEDIVIGERIGLGSYGEVYRGDWHGSEVAVKKFLDQDLSGDALEEFRSEVRIMRRLRHPNVVLFMGAITRTPNLSIITEFLPRGSLYRLIHRSNNHLDERRRLRMALDVAKGMNYLHSGNPVIVHRDLKSPNLLVDKNWVVKVCDFGLSRMKNNTFLSSKSTAGTPEWMAPEMLRNEPSNEKCDVFSFGVILWELATLQQPWGGMNAMQVVGAVGFQHRRLDIPPEMDPVLARIIRECWHDNPNRRPSFTQLMAALRPLQRPLSAAQAVEISRQNQITHSSTIKSQSKQGLAPQEESVT